MEVELRPELEPRRLSEEEISSAINELRQSGRYTPEKLYLIENRLRQSAGLYPPGVVPAQDFTPDKVSPGWSVHGLTGGLPERTRRPPPEGPKIGTQASPLSEEEWSSILNKLHQSGIHLQSMQDLRSGKVQSTQTPGPPPELTSEEPKVGPSVSFPEPTSANLGVSKPPVAVGRLPSLDKEIKHLEDVLAQRQKNLQVLEKQEATYAKSEVPLHLINQIDSEKEEIKKLRPQIGVLKGERELREQYKTELVAAAPIHVALTIAQKGHPTFIDTLAVCERIMPSLFNGHSLLLGYSGSILARQFQAKAASESQKSGQQISAKALIEREIKELEGLAPYHKKDTLLLLGHRLDSLCRAKEALESDQQPVGFSPIPADPIALTLPQFPGSDGGPGICFQLDEKRRLKITVLNQPPTGGQGGSTSIYESYSETDTMVRVVYNYWKVLSSDKFNFFEAPELFGELGKLYEACSRRIKLCRDEIAGYRLPYCIIFLSAFDDPLMSNGLHIPICLALQSAVKEGDQHVLRAEDVQNKSISHLVFVELFNREMLGSGWLDRERLLDLHKLLMTLLPPGAPIILTQEYPYPAQGDGTKEVGD